MPYLPRVIEKAFLESLSLTPVVGVLGPRQSGKSTLIQHLLGDQYRYVTFDQQEMRDIFYSDPNRFMEQYNHHVVFDEVQKLPEIFEFIKIAVDCHRETYGKFVLTGSSQFSFVKGITESLAGRIGLLTLLPFQFSEIPKELRQPSIYCGGYPELVNRHYAGLELWYSSYLTTYLEKDVRSISEIGNIRDFTRFIRLLAANVSQTLNMSHFANDLGVSVSTINRWLSVLEASYIIFLLPPYYKNYGKRLVKSPKIYFYDTGLVAYLTRIKNKELFENGPLTGPLFENYIISETKKKLLHHNQHNELYYFRTNHGVEVDLIIDWFHYKEVIEIKFSQTFNSKMIQPLSTLLEPSDKGFLVYRGETRVYSDNLSLINYTDYLET